MQGVNMSKTISITIPDKLERDLQRKADDLGVSRSRFISNILLNWQSDEEIKRYNHCLSNIDGDCLIYGRRCTAPQSEAESCPEYTNEQV